MCNEIIKNGWRADISLIVTLCIICSLLHASGTSAGYILTRSPSARSSALGDAFGSVDGDIIGVKYNPGILATISQKQLSVMFNKGFINDSYASIMYGFPTAYGSIAYSFDYYNAGILEFYDSLWNKKTVTAEKDTVFALSYGKAITESMYSGITLKYLSSTLVEYKTASVFASDIGVLYSFSDVPVALGFSLQNIGTKLKYIDVGDPIPLFVRISGCYQARNFFVISDTNYFFNDKQIIPSIGIEYLMKNILALRSGYKFNADMEKLSFGFGIKLKNIGVNYSFGLNQIFSNNHTISLDMFFPEFKLKEGTKIKTNYIYVKVTDSEGNPLPKTTVKISEGEEVIAREFTDENGEYSSDGLLLGTYKIKAWHKGYIAEEKEVNIISENPAEIYFILKKN